MKVVKTIASLPDLKDPVCLAIGTFDGVHQGHLMLIDEMNKLGTSLVFTFSNHPTEVLFGLNTTPSISSIDHKSLLLEKGGVEHCVIQPFTEEIAQMPYNLFIEEVYSAVPFSHIFFGEHDVIGKGREGTPEKITELGAALGFKAHYIKKRKVDNITVSSTSTRNALADGNLVLAERLLGRPFSTQINTSDPYLDGGLLKEGRYLVSFKSDSFSTEININNEGIITFNSLPPKYQNLEKEFIQFKEAL